MRKPYGKRVLLALWLAALGMLLSGCASLISEREMADLSQTAIEPGVEAPTQDGAQDRESLFTLYFLAEDGVTLKPVTRSCVIRGGQSRAQAALEALLAGPDEGERGVMWPDLGTARSRMLEVSCGVATVDLGAHARTLPQEMLYAVRLAIANTLTEFSEISYVNVLIGGREEGLDLGATLPVGTLTHVDDPDVNARYDRLLEQRYSSEGVTLLTTMYFPTADGTMILPEVRSIAYAQVSPIEYLYTILREMGKGASLPLCAREFPAPLEFIVEMPEIVRTEDGYLAIELRFDRQLEEELSRNSLTLGIYAAMLSDTLMGFVPGVEGIRISVGEDAVTGFDSDQTPTGEEVVFEHGLATRDDFIGYVGAPVTVYTMAGDGLRRVQRVMEQSRTGDARAKLDMLISMSDEAASALPGSLTPEDVLAVHAGRDTIAVNLSAEFGDALRMLTPQQERVAVYAMVNTLTEGSGASGVEFFFEGEQVQKLAGELEMRGAFVRNPGMVVN